MSTMSKSLSHVQERRLLFRIAFASIFFISLLTIYSVDVYWLNSHNTRLYSLLEKLSNPDNNAAVDNEIETDVLDASIYSRQNAFLINSYHVHRKLSWVDEGDDVGVSVRGLADDGSDTQCDAFHSLNITDVCAFVNATEDCQIDEGFISYTKFIYCNFPGKLVPLGLVIIFLWWLFLFIGLAVTADDFFCPALTVISKTLRMSDNVAGVTFLAFGNGAPDIFSAIAAIGNAKNGDAGLAFGALFGAGVFVTTVVAGTIAIICPFDAMQRPFLRDIIFYIGAVFWSFSVLWDHIIEQYEAIGFIVLYIFYVLVVVLGRYIYQRNKKMTNNGPTVNHSNIQGEANDTEYNQSSEISYDADDELKAPITGSASFYRNDNNTIAQRGHEHGSSGSTDEEDEITPLLNKVREEAPGRTWKDFLSALNPIDTEGWGEKRFYAKIYDIFKCPVQFLLIITIPVVDYGQEDHNWNRYLQTLQMVTGPVFAIIATKVGFTLLYGVFPVWALVLILSVVLAIVVFCTSKTDSKPVYQPAFAFVGFLVAVIWIYIIANEVVNILQTFGVVFSISDAILGLTLLAWGNSVGDFIADTVMARQGYPRMGISACFGGPMFNVLLGIGIPFTIQIIKQGGSSYKLQVTLEEYIMVGFLAFSLLASLVIVPCSKFRMSRPYGIFLWLLYVIFLVVAILTETGVIHANV